MKNHLKITYTLFITLFFLCNFSSAFAGKTNTPCTRDKKSPICNETLEKKCQRDVKNQISFENSKACFESVQFICLAYLKEGNYAKSVKACNKAESVSEKFNKEDKYLNKAKLEAFENSKAEIKLSDLDSNDGDGPEKRLKNDQEVAKIINAEAKIIEFEKLEKKRIEDAESKKNLINCLLECPVRAPMTQKRPQFKSRPRMPLVPSVFFAYDQYISSLLLFS